MFLDTASTTTTRPDFLTDVQRCHIFFHRWKAKHELYHAMLIVNEENGGEFEPNVIAFLASLGIGPNASAAPLALCTCFHHWKVSVKVKLLQSTTPIQTQQFTPATPISQPSRHQRLVETHSNQRRRIRCGAPPRARRRETARRASSSSCCPPPQVPPLLLPKSLHAMVAKVDPKLSRIKRDDSHGLQLLFVRPSPR